MIQSNKGGEHESPFAEIYFEYGIIYQTNVPYTLKSNGLAEQKNTTLKKMMNAECWKV